MKLPKLLFIAALVLSAQTPEVELQRIQQKALASGDYNAAIKSYKSLASRAGSNRKLAAQALLGMADAYQKIGDSQARKIYEQLLRDYSDQKEETAAAQAKLAPASTRDARGVTLRQVWAGPGYTPHSVSPDGRFVSFSYGDTGDLAVRDLTTGAERRLTTTGDWYDYTDASIYSPDGSQLAYTWYVGNEKPERLEIRVVPSSPSAKPTPRTVYRSNRPGSIYPFGWHPDGKQLLVVTYDNGSNRRNIGMLSLDTGAVRTIKSFERGANPIPSLSPDGRWIAYEAAAGAGAEQPDIFLVSVDGAKESRIVENPAIDKYPIWSSDGSRLIFLSSRTGSPSVWSIPVADGKTTGPAELVKADVGRVIPLGVTRGGSLFYTISGRQKSNIHVANIGADGKSAGSPALATEEFLNSNTAPAVSADGAFLAYYSTRAAGQLSLRVRSLGSGEDREVPVRLRLVSFFHSGPLWFPDGKSLLVPATQGAARGFYRVDITSGEATHLHSSVYLNLSSYALSPDGKSIFYCLQSTAGSLFPLNGQLVRYDIGAESPTVLARNRWFIAVAVSKDGSQLAFVESHERDAARKTASSISILPTSGGEPREITRITDWGSGSRYNALTWSTDQKYVVFVHEGIQRVSTQGGEPERIGISMPARIKSPNFSPDGRRLYFSTTETDSSEVWALDNFLPKPPR